MRRLPLLFASAVLCVAVAAEAETSEDVALELADRGAAEIADGNYEAALKLYDEAIRVHAHPTYIFNRARAAAELGDCAGAKADYQLYLRLPKTNEDAHIAASAELERLDAECVQRPQFSAVGDIDKLEPNRRVTEEPVAAKEAGDDRIGWRVAAYSGAVVSAGLVSLTLYYAYQSANVHPNRVTEANLALETPIESRSDICNTQAIYEPQNASVRAACEDGNRAATRTSFFAVSAATSLVLTGALVYMGWISSPEKVQVSPTGPDGGLGMSAAIGF